jgi:hypothetical protein
MKKTSSRNVWVIAVLAIVLTCIIGLCCWKYNPVVTEPFLDSNSSDRRLVYENPQPTRNELISPLFGKTLTDGSMDISVQKTAWTEFKNRISFYPYQYNYDMFCDAVNQESLSSSMVSKRQQLCSVYDLNSLAIQQENARNHVNYKNSVVLMDNNFYNIYSKSGVFFSVDSIELIGNIRPELQRIVRLRVRNLSETFLLLRPAFIFVPMVGLFSVVYDFQSNDNIMNFYDSQMKNRVSYLYLESVNTEKVASKPILPTVNFNEQASSILKSQFNLTNCTIFYLLPDESYQSVPPIDQACIATFDLQTGTISQFDIGNAQSSENVYIPSIKILLSKEDGLQILCKGASIVKTLNREQTKTILNNFQVRKIIVTFSFNTVTCSIFYLNPTTNQTGFFIFREVPVSITIKDRLFALQTKLVDIDQMTVKYSLPDLVNIAKSVNIDVANRHSTA